MRCRGLSCAAAVSGSDIRLPADRSASNALMSNGSSDSSSGSAGRSSAAGDAGEDHNSSDARDGEAAGVRKDETERCEADGDENRDAGAECGEEGEVKGCLARAIALDSEEVRVGGRLRLEDATRGVKAGAVTRSGEVEVERRERTTARAGVVAAVERRERETVLAASVSV